MASQKVPVAGGGTDPTGAGSPKGKDILAVVHEAFPVRKLFAEARLAIGWCVDDLTRRIVRERCSGNLSDGHSNISNDRADIVGGSRCYWTLLERVEFGLERCPRAQRFLGCRISR